MTIRRCLGPARTTRTNSSRVEELFNTNETATFGSTCSTPTRAFSAGPPIPPTTATRFTGCSTNWVPIPRRNRAKSTSITPTPSFKPTSTGLPPTSPSCRTPKPISWLVADQFLRGGRRPAVAALHDELVPVGSIELSPHFLRHRHQLLPHHQQHPHHCHQRPEWIGSDQHSVLWHDQPDTGVWHHEHSGSCERPICLFTCRQPSAPARRQHLRRGLLYQ